MKTYGITLSHAFPKTHSRAGQPTYFPALFRAALSNLKQTSKKAGSTTKETLSKVTAATNRHKNE